MPVVVPRALMEPWLDPLLVDPAEVRALLAAVPDPVLAPREVSRAVGSVRNNAPGLIAPVDAPPPTEEVPL
jgi:putative SOS response-associated peptidase YedK